MSLIKRITKTVMLATAGSVAFAAVAYAETGRIEEARSETSNLIAVYPFYSREHQRIYYGHVHGFNAATRSRRVTASAADT